MREEVLVVAYSRLFPGPIVRVAPNEVHINDLSATREIHKVGGRYLKSKWYETLVPPGIVNVFTVSDPNYHSALRRLLAGPMADNQVKVFEPLVTSRVRLAISRIGEELERRGAADVFKWWLFFATDVIGELSFGDSFRMLETGKVWHADNWSLVTSLAYADISSFLPPFWDAVEKSVYPRPGACVFVAGRSDDVPFAASLFSIRTSAHVPKRVRVRQKDRPLRTSVS